MIDTTRLYRYLKFAVPGVFLLWLLIDTSSSVTIDHSRYDYLFRQFRSQKDVFVEDFLSHDVDGSFDGSSIAELCANKTWTQGLMLTCEAAPGGLADVTNSFTTCLRTAIEMGAEVVLPGIVRRSEIDLSVTVPHDVGPRRGVGLEHFFDREHLTRSLAEHCPQMAVHASMDRFADDPNALTVTKLEIEKLEGLRMAPTGDTTHPKDKLLSQPEKLGAQIHAYLDQKSPPRDRRYPFHVHLRPVPAYLFPTMDEPDALVQHFGRLFRVRADLRRLAAAALFNLHTAFALQLDPRSGLHSDASYAAVELRTARDAQVAKFPPYAVQASDALSFVTAHNASVVYLATGATVDNATAWATRARDFQIKTVTLEDIVEGEDAATLRNLAWDQRGLVDYEIVMRAGLFAGTAHSSSAWHAALRRQYAFGTNSYANTTQLNGTIRYHDDFSTLYGRTGAGATLALAIWP